MAVVDFNDAVEFTAIDGGVYLATLTEKKYVPQSKNSGNPTEQITFTIAEGEHEGAKMFRTCSLMPTGLSMTKDFLVSLGVDPERLEGKADIDLLLEPFVGSQYMITVTNKVHYQAARAAKGERMNNIDTVVSV